MLIKKKKMLANTARHVTIMFLNVYFVITQMIRVTESESIVYAKVRF